MITHDDKKYVQRDRSKSIRINTDHFRELEIQNQMMTPAPAPVTPINKKPSNIVKRQASMMLASKAFKNQ